MLAFSAAMSLVIVGVGSPRLWILWSVSRAWRNALVRISMLGVEVLAGGLKLCVRFQVLFPDSGRIEGCAEIFALLLLLVVGRDFFLLKNLERERSRCNTVGNISRNGKRRCEFVYRRDSSSPIVFSFRVRWRTWGMVVILSDLRGSPTRYEPKRSSSACPLSPSK